YKMPEKPLVAEDIAKVQFACDLTRCKGACCTMPGARGAPLREEELGEIEKAYPTVRKYLSFGHKDAIEERGLVQGRKADYTTQVVQNQACVFALFENGIAKCAFEKAYLNNEIGWRKPISCHLFPIRVALGVPERLRFECIAECQPATERGTTEHIWLSEFLGDSLTRAYGESWYQEFRLYCEARRNGELTS
ncbi:MAG: DUF3109 family protein, partial [Ignavibacteriales bacterium]|nr:DUF3109 family protein [Ignavibacteriales bacterium]